MLKKTAIRDYNAPSSEPFRLYSSDYVPPFLKMDMEPVSEKSHFKNEPRRRKMCKINHDAPSSEVNVCSNEVRVLVNCSSDVHTGQRGSLFSCYAQFLRL
jgi:hypothetical protein